MANQEHLAVLRQGVEKWNDWRKRNPQINPDLSGAKLSEEQLRGANLSSSFLTYADLFDTDLEGANFRGADTRNTDFREAILEEAILEGADLTEADLEGADLSRAKLRKTNLRNAYLGYADLEGADLTEADLTGADLTAAQALSTVFKGATLTEACLEDWNINSETNLDNVICNYVYLKQNQQERRPSDQNRNFKPGEFANLVKKSVETVDLIFSDGIDWKAFLSSYQDIQVKYGNENVSIQAIEKKSDGAFVIRLSVPPEADKAEIESYAKQSYETKVKVLEAQYRAELKGLEAHHKDEIISLRKEHNTQILELAKLAASRPINVETWEVTNRKIYTGGGEYRETNLQDDSRYVETGDNSTYYENYNSPQEKTLAEAAEEIQKLLQQLEQTNPTATVEQQQAYVDAAISPTLKQRCVGALKAMSDTVIEEFLQRPGVKVVASGVKGWLLPD